MNAEDFATLCKRERDSMLAEYIDQSGSTVVSGHLTAASLSSVQREHVVEALGVAITDTFYTILMALDGEASLGSIQQEYSVVDKIGNIICCGNGKLGSAAYAAFHLDEG